MSTKSQAIIGTATAAVGACACAYAAYQFRHSFSHHNKRKAQEGQGQGRGRGHEVMQQAEPEPEPEQGYGISGMLRYIWEGDHLPPHIREVMDALDDIEVRQKKLQKKLNKIDVTIQTAKLNSVDNDDDGDDDDNENENENPTREENETSDHHHPQGHQATTSTTPIHTKKHYILAQIPSLANDLGTLSYNLDGAAADVDAVQSSGDVNVKRRKKQLSSKLVEMMDKVDGFMKECGVDGK